MQKLNSGKILVENVNTSGSGGSVKVQALMHLAASSLWTYIADCERVLEYVDGMQECELLEVRKEPGVDISKVHQVVDKGWMVPEMDYVIEVRREPWSKVDFHLLEGDLKAMQGSWRFEKVGDGELLVTHEIQVRPSFPVPRWLIRRSMRRDIPDMLACLRGLTDGSGPFPRSRDLERCPDHRH